MFGKAIPTMLLIPLICLVATACGSSVAESTNPKQDIVGSWSCGQMNVTFSSNKVSFSGSAQAGITSSGSASNYFVDSTHIYGVWESVIPTYEVHIRGNKMELKGNDGSTETCTRK